mmetsp:Transcript_1674/g.3583  ORF Transcript_1674/g.3583 Transcript_1674/m.3583 type:complete len:104 (-) Transcript_1674:99-410(-)
MTNVDVFDERLHGARPLFDLLLGHAAGDFAGPAGNSGNEAVGKALVVVSIFVSLDDNGFLASVAASKDDNNFSGFENGHFGLCYDGCRVRKMIVRCRLIETGK